MARQLFDAEFLHKLEFLQLIARRIFAGRVKGERRSPRHGTSIEFADYREYESGDDFRYVDWNIYSRLDKLFVKLFTEEEDLSIHILIDSSNSMSFGSPPKMDYAARVAAALGYIGLSDLDRVGVASFSSKLARPLPPTRGKNQVFNLFNYLENIECGGETNFSQCVQEYILRTRGAGVMILISDLMDSNGYERGLDFLRYRKFDIFLLQIVCDEELDPRVRGEVKFIDAETRERIELTVSEPTLNYYKGTVEKFFSGIEDYCLKRQIDYIRTSTSIPFEELVLKYLRYGGFLK